MVGSLAVQEVRRCPDGSVGGSGDSSCAPFAEAAADIAQEAAQLFSCYNSPKVLAHGRTEVYAAARERPTDDTNSLHFRVQDRVLLVESVVSFASTAG